MLTVESAPRKSWSALCLLLGGCSAAAPPAPREPPPRCSERLASSAPAAVRAPPLELPSSRLTLVGEISEQQLLAQIAAQIPSTLAQEKRRPIGAPGEVTYTVKRGALDSSVKDGVFHFVTLANAEIEICKPLGPFCVTYGRCQPVLATTVSLPLTLTRDFAWQRATSSVRAEQGCQIAGFDVTGRLTSIARSNLDAVERRIQSSLPPVKPSAERVWELLHNPIFLDKDHCLRLEPERFLQSPVRETAEGYRLGVGLELRFVLSDECKQEIERPPLAPLATVDRLDGPSRVLLLQSLDLEALTAELNRSSRGKFGFGENLEHVSVTTAKLGDASKLLLEVKLNGVSCGTTWLEATLKPAGDSLALSDVRPLDPALPEGLAALPKHLESTSKLRPGMPFGDAVARLAQLLETLLTLADERVAISAELGAPKLLRAGIDHDRVWAIAETPWEIRVTLKEPSQTNGAIGR